MYPWPLNIYISKLGMGYIQVLLYTRSEANDTYDNIAKEMEALLLLVESLILVISHVIERLVGILLTF